MRIEIAVTRRRVGNRFFAIRPPVWFKMSNDWQLKPSKILSHRQDKARELPYSEDISVLWKPIFQVQKCPFSIRYDQFPLSVRASPSSRQSFEDLGNLSITANGQLISLDRVANISPFWKYSSLPGKISIRLITVSAKATTLIAVNYWRTPNPNWECTEFGCRLMRFAQLQVKPPYSADVNANSVQACQLHFTVMVFCTTCSNQIGQRVH